MRIHLAGWYALVLMYDRIATCTFVPFVHGLRGCCHTMFNVRLPTCGRAAGFQSY